MTMTTQHAPEVLYADTVRHAQGYHRLSQRYAAEGQTLLAVHATWCADLKTVQAVMWERVMIACPEPDEQFFAIAATVARALARYAGARPSADSARGAVEAARAGLAQAFDPSARELLDRRYPSLDHLDGLPHPGTEEGLAIARQKLGGRSVAELSTDRVETARQSMAVARRLHQEGRLDEAMRHAWQADWATFEAYLLDAAAAVGDENLTTVELRWALAVESTSAITALPGDFADAVRLIRRRMAEALGAIEGDRLQERLEPVA